MTDQPDPAPIENSQIVTPLNTNTNRRKWTSVIIIIFLLGIIASLALIYRSAIKKTRAINSQVTQLQSQVSDTQDQLKTMQQSLIDIHQTAQKSQDLSTQQEQILTEWRAAQKGDLDKWHVAEAQYLVKLANDHLQFTHHISMAKNLLQQADQLLQTTEEIRALQLRKSIASALSSIENLPDLDVTGLFVQIAGLDDQLDQLTFPVNPLKDNAAPITNDPKSTWWRSGLHQTWQALQKIVIVRNNGSNALPLVLPEESVFLRQNLHAQMQSALWAVLNRDAEVYASSIKRAITWVETYYDPNAVLTKTVLQRLNVLQKIDLKPPVVNLADTLQLFDAYFAKSENTQKDSTQGTS